MAHWLFWMKKAIGHRWTPARLRASCNSPSDERPSPTQAITTEPWPSGTNSWSMLGCAPFARVPSGLRIERLSVMAAILAQRGRSARSPAATRRSFDAPRAAELPCPDDEDHRGRRRGGRGDDRLLPG